MLLAPSGYTVITMARKVLEASEIRALGTFSFTLSTDNQIIYVMKHNDKTGSELYETVTLSQLIASYIGLTLKLDLDANDAVTTGHRLGNTGK